MRTVVLASAWPVSIELCAGMRRVTMPAERVDVPQPTAQPASNGDRCFGPCASISVRGEYRPTVSRGSDL